MHKNMYDNRPDQRFKLRWLDGKTEVIVGKDIADAFSRAGYGAGAVCALDDYEKL